MVAKGPPGGVGVPLLQGGPEVGDPLLDLLQPGRGLRLQALTFSTALIPGTLPDPLQPRALILELRDHFPYLSSPAEHTLMILGRNSPRLPRRPVGEPRSPPVQPGQVTPER
jgi:hypothetical protein